MKTYTIFRAIELAISKVLRDSQYGLHVNKTTIKHARQLGTFRDEMVRRCERYDLAKMQIKDLKEERDQLIRGRWDCCSHGYIDELDCPDCGH